MFAFLGLSILSKNLSIFTQQSARPVRGNILMQFVHGKVLPIFILAIFLLAFSYPTNSLAAPDDKSLRSSTVQNIENDDIRGEDLRIRKVAIEALGNRAGTVVVMSPQSGRIYTIVNQDWAVRRGFKPCSTIKLVTGIAGYNENLINSNGTIASGAYRLGLNDSLAYSNNPFFQKVGANLGNGKMVAYAKKLGLGERTGINIAGENPGKLPYGNDNLRIYSHADDFEVTPLQLAVLVSAISNGGDLVIPQVINSNFSKINFRGYYKRQLDLAPTVFERVIPGMVGAVKYGTAKQITDSHLKIAGKTGSCIANGTWVGLFASVAPINDPRFSVVVITEGKYARGKVSAGIAGKIYQSLRGRFNESYKGTLARKAVYSDDQNQVASDSKKVTRIVSSKPRTGTPSSIKNKSEDRDSASIAKTRIIKVKQTPDTPKTEELFPTIVIKGKTEITRPRVVQN